MESQALRTVEFKTGKIIENKPLDNAFFGEGLTVLQDRIVQLTWKAQKGLVYDKASLNMQKSFPFGASKEGWGLCNDGNTLYKSDGTQNIWKLNPEEYNELGTYSSDDAQIRLKKHQRIGMGERKDLC